MVNISQVNSNTLQLNNPNKIALNDFKIGQVLTATIVKPIGNQLLLQIGSQSLLADTKLTNLTAGNIQVTVKQTHPSVILSINDLKTANQTSQQTQNLINNTLQTTYRQALGQQLPIHQALNQILTLPNLPAVIQTSIQLLLEQLLRPKPNLDGKDLKQLFSQSGLFLENNLKQNRSQTPFNQDTKAQLLKLQNQTLALLQNTPNSAGLKQLNSLINQAINKLTVQQLQLYENPNLVNIELPVQASSQLQVSGFEIYRHKAPNEKTWEVLIKVTIDEQHMEVKLQLNEEQNQLSCYVWCESLALEDKIRTHQDRLAEQFQQLNLTVSKIEVVQKPFKASEFVTKVALIDISV
ncbi:MAG: hypothetical protein JXK16_01710 [Thiotrichales bacterium]|nr:hypothetical protein [Thiotrichales bacterium]